MRSPRDIPVRESLQFLSLLQVRSDSSSPIPHSITYHSATAAAVAHDRSGAWGILVATGLPAYIFQKPAHGIELRAETCPVSGLQVLHCLIVVVECLARPICRRACERRSCCGTRGRPRGRPRVAAGLGATKSSFCLLL